MYGLTLETTVCPDGVEIQGSVFRPRSSRKFPLRLETRDLSDPLILRFFNADDDDALADFLGRFGHLQPEQHESPRRRLLTNQRQLRHELIMAGSDNPDDRRSVLPSGLDVKAALNGDILDFRVLSLFGLMWMEAAMVVEKDARLTACEHCEIAFLTGPTTGRRSHALYCSDRCRVAAMRARQAS